MKKNLLLMKGFTIGFILLFIRIGSFVIITNTSLCSAVTYHELDDYYFENVNILVIGRCSSVTSTDGWLGGLFVGKQEYPGIGVHDNILERIKIVIYNESIFKHQISLSKMKNISIFMNNAEGIFFWGGGIPYHVRLIPPVVILWCHAEKLWIYNLPSY